MTRTRTVYGAVNPNAEQDRERAAEARHGGRVATQPYTQRWTADTLRLSARAMAARGYWSVRSAESPRLTLTAAESMMDWPIYRAAMAADTFAALWGQAAPGMEERILNTLARCAGMREYTLSPEGDE
jgi:hypothetical protein